MSHVQLHVDKKSLDKNYSKLKSLVFGYVGIVMFCVH